MTAEIDLNITIFGGTGDLTFRKLLPAFYTMDLSGKLPRNVKIVSIGRRGYDSAAYRRMAGPWVEKFSRLPYSAEGFSRFSERLYYYKMDFTDKMLYRDLEKYYEEEKIGAHIFYLAVAPRFFSVIADGLAGVRGACGGKVIIEKPFGESLETAKALNQKLEDCFGAENIYRIDHYLGKEMVQNIQAIRFYNPIFSDTWNSRFIEQVQISALEDVGVETRGGYYDASGALKDMVQNHLLQILSIVAMEKPEKRTVGGMKEEQMKVLKALRPVGPETVGEALILGQYDGYREEALVSPESETETFAALRLFIDNPRWENTPFYIRTGKKTGKREMEVAVIFRRPDPAAAANVLIIKIQPTEGVYLQFNIKRPGDTDELTEAKMDFCQNCSLIHLLNTPEAYERLLSACIRGERSWFSQWDQIETSWSYVENLKKLYREAKLPIARYSQGKPGPPQAEAFPEETGHGWFGEAGKQS